jgi:hypothetical protein
LAHCGVTEPAAPSLGRANAGVTHEPLHTPLWPRLTERCWSLYPARLSGPHIAFIGTLACPHVAFIIPAHRLYHPRTSPLTCPHVVWTPALSLARPDFAPALFPQTIAGTPTPPFLCRSIAFACGLGNHPARASSGPRVCLWDGPTSPRLCLACGPTPSCPPSYVSPPTPRHSPQLLA